MSFYTQRNSNLFPFDQFLKTTSKGSSFSPAANISVDDSNFYIELSLAGYPKEKIKISTFNSILSIQYLEEEQEKESKSMKILSREFKRENFVKKFKLPKNLDIEQIKAQQTDGILRITLPMKKVEKMPEQQISID